MHIIEQYQYRKLERITQPNGIRHYICPDSGKKLPSVTTILDRTSDKTNLLEWRKRVGDKKADQSKHEGIALGTLMHSNLECHIIGEQRPGGNNYLRLMATRMADRIIERGLVQIDAVWGSEVMLYVPQLYAGTTDLVGTMVSHGKCVSSIVDFKTAKKLRDRAMIEDYFLQLGAYSLCHDELYGTAIQRGVIFMVSRDCDFREFVIERDELRKYQIAFIERLDLYYILSDSILLNNRSPARSVHAHNSDFKSSTSARPIV